jgi:hypothetical protein
MIAYCKKFVADLESEPDNEAWMSEAVQIEKAIIQVLESVGSKQEAVGSTPSVFNEDFIGQLIRQRVALNQQVNELTLLVEGSSNPENIAGYREQLQKRKDELSWTMQGLREAKQRHKLHLQQRLAAVQADIDSTLTELADEMDLRHLHEDLVKKIETIDNELKAL